MASTQDTISKYCVDSETTRLADGRMWVCNSCSASMNVDQEPERCLKEFFGFLDFPQSFKDTLQTVCTPSPLMNTDRAKFIKLNRLEDFLLKICIPFIRIGHLPRGRYFRVQGGLIMISADLQTTIDKVLPCQQHLIPVVFKRKLSYQGHFIEEWIDRNKVLAYFTWFRTYNHLFENYALDENIIAEFESQALESLSKCHTDMEESVDDEGDEDQNIDVHLHPDAGCSSSVIVDKYQEDSKRNTVANKFARMIIEIETKISNASFTVPTTDPEEHDYPEDEPNEELNDNFSDDDQDCPEINNLDENDMKIYDKVINATKSLETKAKITGDLCRCNVAMRISYLIKVLSEIQMLKPLNEDLMTLTEDTTNSLRELIQVARDVWRNKPDCNHQMNDLEKLFRNLLDRKDITPEKISEFVRKQKKNVRNNLQTKLFVAPGEKGKIQNWQSDVFLEEKLFPALFPYGIGGYLSSNVIRSSNIGFANYVKSRLLSADPKFRADPYYMFFLLLVKEMVEMLRSESTFYRKAGKASGLTPQIVKEISPEFMHRYNTAFNAFKHLRGTSMYFQAVKKNLMAFIRQKGAPTLFVTLSSAEFQWDEMIHKIYETTTRTQVTLDFIKSQSSAWKNKLVHENVVQSTMHFSKRVSKLISYLTNESPFCHDDVMYLVSDYFYRIEFQVRV